VGGQVRVIVHDGRGQRHGGVGPGTRLARAHAGRVSSRKNGWGSAGEDDAAGDLLDFVVAQQLAHDLEAELQGGPGAAARRDEFVDDDGHLLVSQVFHETVGDIILGHVHFRVRCAHPVQEARCRVALRAPRLRVDGNVVPARNGIFCQLFFPFISRSGRYLSLTHSCC